MVVVGPSKAWGECIIDCMYIHYIGAFGCAVALVLMAVRFIAGYFWLSVASWLSSPV
ncbi:MAG: hypothetical protein ACJA0N_000348 [Pseudohongiellaceae bacterium]|jgi:hypothetical protein